MFHVACWSVQFATSALVASCIARNAFTSEMACMRWIVALIRGVKDVAAVHVPLYRTTMLEAKVSLSGAFKRIDWA